MRIPTHEEAIKAGNKAERARYLEWSRPMENGTETPRHGEHPRQASRFLRPEVATILRRGRLARGWSLRMAARRTTVAASHICMLEGGHRSPSTTVAELLIDAYEITGSAADALRAEAIPAVGRAWKGHT